MAASVSTKEATTTLRHIEQPSPSKLALGGSSAPLQIAVRDTNKRRCLASTDELETLHTKQTDALRIVTSSLELSAAAAYNREQCEEKRQIPTEDAQCEVEGRGVGEEISTEIAAIAAKNEQLHVSLVSLKRKFSLREDDTHQLLLGLGALNAVTNELAALQKDYQERSAKNAALVQESLVQISNCSAQVDILKKSQGLKVAQLHTLRQVCGQEMNRLIARLEDLAETTCQEPEPFEGNDDDGLCTATHVKEDLQQCGQWKEEEEEHEHRAHVIDDRSFESASGRSQQETTDRIKLALAHLDNLHAEMFQLKQTLVHENQSFRRHLEELLSRQMAHARELQDNETERIHEEMDEIRSGMCAILKDIHRLKERTKYLVPSMARPPPLPFKVIGRRRTGQWMSPPAPSFATPMPHERNYDWMMPSQMEARNTRLNRPHSSRSSNSSDDENWRAFAPGDAPATGHRATQPCKSPHYSSRSSSLSGHLSVYGGTSTCVQMTSRPECPEELARRRSVVGEKWERINFVDCTRLRRRG